jgi:hypothetical protein
MRQRDLARPNGWCNSLLIYGASFLIVAFDTTSWAHGFAGDRFFPPTSTPENRGGGPTTGTINPGILWGNRHVQIGAEAIIPLNKATSSEVGAVFQVQFFIDDLLPRWFGHPIIGGEQGK